jgi:hypothetical protein
MMAEQDVERRMRVAQHLRVFVKAMRANPLDVQALPAGVAQRITDFVASARDLAKLYDPGNENGR